MKTVLLVLVLSLVAACAARPAALPSARTQPALPERAEPAEPPEQEPARQESAGTLPVQPGPVPAVPQQAAPSPPPAEAAPPSKRSAAPAPETAMAGRPPLPEPRQEPPLTDERLQKLILLAEMNDERLLEIFVGMYRGTVQGIMGFSGQNPYKREVITGIDGSQYEVLFYLTREPRKGKGVTERQLTPVIFRDDRVIAMGRYPLLKLRRTGTLGKVRLPSAEPARLP